MASVIVLAEDEVSDVAFTSDAAWVEAGSSLTTQLSYGGSGTVPVITMEGSLDGVN